MYAVLMQALIYLFPFQLLLLLVVALSFVALLLIPTSIFKQKKWGWRFLGVMIIVLIFSFWHYTQPKEYPQNYLAHKADTVEILANAAKNSNFYIGAAVYKLNRDLSIFGFSSH